MSIRSTISRLKRGRVLDFGPGLLEDFAQHPRLLAEFFEDVPVMGLQFVAVELHQARPTQRRRHDRLAVVGRLGQFVGHLQEEQEGDLLRVGHVRKAVVPQDVGEVPGFVDDVLGGGAHSMRLVACFRLSVPLRSHSSEFLASLITAL